MNTLNLTDLKENKKQKAFMLLYDQVHEAFSRYCSAKSYGIIDAKELASETIMRAYSNFEKLRNKEAFLGFLFGIASNIIKNTLRKKKIFDEYDEAKLVSIPQNGIDPTTRIDIEILYKALNQLPVKQKDALVLFEISGFSIKEIMQIQNSSESAIKQRLKRGREKLASILKSDELKEEPLHMRSKILVSVFYKLIDERE
ncbi:MAG: RNA polymerase sigma factor [Chloroflexia bacterium]|nr:RNA polymerase sigma factor [Chloroflexia bacterium]